MIGKIKFLFKKAIYGHTASSEAYTEHLKKIGARVGKNISIYSPNTVIIDDTTPCLLSIGDDVVIAKGVIILTHDGAWGTLKCLEDDLEGQILGAQGPVKIGNNVFIGMNAIICRGVTVGDNVIIGVGSVVTKDCEPNSVYAGAPAKKIMSIEQYREKRAAAQLEEAKILARTYKEVYGKNPPMEFFKEYFMLFASPEQAAEIPEFRHRMEFKNNFVKSMEFMKNNPPMFKSYQEFLSACFKES